MTRARGASRPRFRLLPTVLLTLAILGLPTVVYAWGRSSSSFDIVAVRVDGTRLVPENRVQRLLRREFTGRNLFTVTEKDVRAALQSFSLVSGVAIDRAFPDTLLVNVAEYVPAAYASTGSRWFVLDANGYAICTAARAAEQVSGGSATAPESSAAPSPSPTATDPAASQAVETTGNEASSTDASTLDRLLSGPAKEVLRLPRLSVSGRVREGSVVRDPGVAGMLRVIAALPGSLRRRLDVVQEDGGQLTLRFADGPVTTWGDSERTLAKTVALRTVLARYDAAGKTCTQLDVSTPDRTLAKPVLR